MNQIVDTLRLIDESDAETCWLSRNEHSIFLRNRCHERPDAPLACSRMRISLARARSRRAWSLTPLLRATNNLTGASQVMQLPFGHRSYASENPKTPLCRIRELVDEPTWRTPCERLVAPHRLRTIGEACRRGVMHKPLRTAPSLLGPWIKSPKILKTRSALQRRVLRGRFVCAGNILINTICGGGHRNFVIVHRWINVMSNSVSGWDRYNFVHRQPRIRRCTP